ncbi:MAG: hypothetical protein ABIA93_04990 [Candidatus Woesearchaeota archaeon]
MAWHLRLFGKERQQIAMTLTLATTRAVIDKARNDVKYFKRDRRKLKHGERTARRKELRGSEPLVFEEERSVIEEYREEARVLIDAAKMGEIAEYRFQKELSAIIAKVRGMNNKNDVIIQKLEQLSDYAKNKAQQLQSQMRDIMLGHKRMRETSIVPYAFLLSGLRRKLRKESREAMKLKHIEQKVNEYIAHAADPSKAAQHGKELLGILNKFDHELKKEIDWIVSTEHALMILAARMENEDYKEIHYFLERIKQEGFSDAKYQELAKAWAEAGHKVEKDFESLFYGEQAVQKKAA